MLSGEAWASLADLRVVYTDQGETKGMAWGIRHAKGLGQQVEYRTLVENGSEED